MGGFVCQARVWAQRWVVILKVIKLSFLVVLGTEALNMVLFCSDHLLVSFVDRLQLDTV
jgi:hypothetical protein